MVKIYKIFFFITAFLTFQKLSSQDFSKYIEYKYSGKLSLPKESSSKEKSYDANTGLKISFSPMEFRAYTNTKEISFENLRYGSAFFLAKNFLPIELKIGHNTYAASISRMKNPSPSTTANPLTKSFSFKTGLSASLPTLGSTNKIFSSSILVKTKDGGFPFHFSSEAFMNEKKERAVNISGKFIISRSIYTKSSLTLGYFQIENNSQILKKNNALFTPDFFYAGLGEFCFHSPILKLNFYMGYHESPYEINPWWLRIDGKTSFGALLLNFSYFAIPTTKDSPKAVPLMGISSSICRTVEQASINPQILLLFNDEKSSSLNFGVSLLENWKVTATNVPVQINTGKMRSAIKYENTFSSIEIDYCHGNILIQGVPPTRSSKPEEYRSTSLSSTLSGKNVRLLLSSEYKLCESISKNYSKKQEISSNIKLAVPIINSTIQGGVKMQYKDKERGDSEFSLAFSHVIKKKYLKSSFRFEILTSF